VLDVRPTAYVSPLDEQPIGPLTPIIHVENLADEDATITGLVRIYRESLGVLLYSSVLHPTAIAHGTSADIAVETEFDPGAPADDDYFCLAEITARSTLTGNSETVQLGQFYFDVKPGPMGPPPATHHTTHENGGMDPIDVEDLGTDELNNTRYLRADGTGALEFASPPGGVTLAQAAALAIALG
jgi:hypothetical protein